MNEDKANILIKWVNTVDVGKSICSLKDLSDGHLMLKMVYKIDECFEAEKNGDDRQLTDLFKVISYLQGFFQMSLDSIIDENKIKASKVLEIAKVLSLLLYCSVQGENAGWFVEKIFQLDENVQFGIKMIIETILKQVEAGTMNMEKLESILISSDIPNCQEFSFSPMSAESVLSPVLHYDSPIRALMASPQMRSRSSQVTITKLHKKLKQLEMTIKSQQHNLNEVEQRLQEKNKVISDQDLKIGCLSKEIAKIPGLEEEIQSLSRFENESKNVKFECERLEKKLKELHVYKQRYVKLEKDFSDYVTSSTENKNVLESRLKDLKSNEDEKITDLLSSLKERDRKSMSMENQLLAASSVEVELRTRLNQLETSYKAELLQLQTALDESKKSREEACEAKEKELLAQIARENDLKKCFKEKSLSYESTIDQMQLENANMRLDVDGKNQQIKDSTHQLDVIQRQLKTAVDKITGYESKINELVMEKEQSTKRMTEERDELYADLQERNSEIVTMKDSLSVMEKEIETLEDSRNRLVVKNTEISSRFEEQFLSLQKTNQLIQERESDLKNVNDKYMHEKRINEEEIELLQLKLSEMTSRNEQYKEQLEENNGEISRLVTTAKHNEEEMIRWTMDHKKLKDNHDELIQRMVEKEQLINQMLEECETLKENNNSLCCSNIDLAQKMKKLEETSNTEKNVLLQSNDSLNKELQQSLIEYEKAQNCLTMSTGELRAVMEEYSKYREKVKELEILKLEKESLKLSVEENKKLKNEKSAMNERIGELQSLFDSEKSELENAKSALEEKVNEVNLLKVEYEDVKRILNEERILKQREDVDLKNQFEKLEASLKRFEDENVSAKESKVKMEEERKVLSVEIENLKLGLKSSKEDNTLLHNENLVLQENIKELECLRIAAIEEKASLTETLEKNDMRLKLLEKDNEKLKSDLEHSNNKIILLDNENMQLKLIKQCSSKDRDDQQRFASDENMKELTTIKSEHEKLITELKCIREEKTALINDKSCLENKIREMEKLVDSFEKEKSHLYEVNSLLKQKTENLENGFNNLKNASSENCASLANENSQLQKKIDKLEKLHCSSSNESKLALVVKDEKLQSLETVVEELESSQSVLSMELCESQNEVEKLRSELQKLKSIFTSCDQGNISLTSQCLQLKETADKVHPLEVECKRINDLLLLSNEENMTLHNECSSLRTGIKNLEKGNESKNSFSDNNKLIESQSVQSKVEQTSRHEILLTPKNKSTRAGLLRDVLLKETAENINVSEVFDDSLEIPVEEYVTDDNNEPDCAETVTKTTIPEDTSLTPKLLSVATSLDCLRKQWEETKKSVLCERNDMKKIQDDVEKYFVKLANIHALPHRRKCSKFLEEERDVEQFEDEKSREDEKSPRGQLSTEMSVIEENGNPEESQRCYVSEGEREEQLEEELVKKRNETMALEEELRISKSQNEKLTNLVPELKNGIRSLKEKLNEEELICKRLGMQVKSLEAQLIFADKQLREKFSCENTSSEKLKEYTKEERTSSLTISKPSVTYIGSEDNLGSNLSSNITESNETLNDYLLNSTRQCDDNNNKTVNQRGTHDKLDARKIRRRSALYLSKDDLLSDTNEHSTVGGAFFMVHQFTNEDEEPTCFDNTDYNWNRMLDLQKQNGFSLPDIDNDWNRIQELQKRNAACLPHMRSSYPVETQTRDRNEMNDEDIKSGDMRTTRSRKRLRDDLGNTSVTASEHTDKRSVNGDITAKKENPTVTMTTRTSKRLRDNGSDGNLSVKFNLSNNNTFDENHPRPLSKSDDRLSKRFSERLAAKFIPQKSKKPIEHQNLLSSSSSLDRNRNCSDFSRRESIAFNVQVSPAKKSRPPLSRGSHHPVKKSEIALDSLNKKKEKIQNLKKFSLPRKNKGDRKPLTSKNI